MSEKDLKQAMDRYNKINESQNTHEIEPVKELLDNPDYPMESVKPIKEVSEDEIE